jgi:tetratricopeptide (TPR) repeat protein
VSASMITDLVLVHGFWSSPATWNKLAVKMQNDPELDGLRIHRFGYPSPKFRLPGVPSRIPDYDDTAQVFPSFLEARIPRNGSVAVVTHSQGGLILQRFLAWMLREGRGRDLARVQLAVMLACPNEGSEYLASMRAAAGFNVHPQAKALRVLDTQVSEARRVVLRQIVNADHIDERHCPIPFYVYSGASDNIVRRASAQSMFPQTGVLPGDHFSILDPDSPGNLTFDVIKRHLLKTVDPTPVAAARRIRESRSRIALNIHPAIGLPGHYPDLSAEFPEYVARAIDEDLRSWIRSRVPVGGLVVLVGDAAAGKTRCLFEALNVEVPDWKMPYLDGGADIAATVQEGADLASTVLWLDDLQNFFADGSLTAGTVQRLLAGHLGPVLLAATIRTEELDRLVAQPAADERESPTRHHARQIIRMLVRLPRHDSGQEPAIRFEVDKQFEPEELARAKELAAVDPRIQQALRQASDGNVTATLAGAPELIARWSARTGNRHGRAVITAAVTARRCGHPEPIPIKVLEALAVSQLTAEADPLVAPGWLQAAINWAAQPTEGGIAALRAVATTPGMIDGYKVSDILLQHSYDENCPVIRPLLDEPKVWVLLLEYAAALAWTGIGDAAYAEGHANVAEQAWKQAADAQDLGGMRRLGWLYTDQGRQDNARQWFEQAIARDDTAAMLGFAFSLQHFEQFDESLSWMRRAAEREDPDAMASLGFELQGMGQVDEAETWYRRATSFDHPLAMANLGYLLYQRDGDTEEAELWTRKAAALGYAGALENLAQTLKKRGQVSEALEWSRKAAERALSLIDENPGRYDDPFPGEATDDGISNSILHLAEHLSELGEVNEAEQWFQKIADIGDGRAASALANLFLERGQPSRAAGWRKKAAESSHALLSQRKHELLCAYGVSSVVRHVHIIQEYAKYLAAQGETEESRTWRQRASEHLPPGSSNEEPVDTQMPS